MIRGGVVTLLVSDVASAVRFYVETLGMKLVDEADGTVTLDAGDGFAIALRIGDTPTIPIERRAIPAVTFRTKVPIDEAIAIYENRGVVFEVERTARATVARFRDPDGNALALTQG